MKKLFILITLVSNLAYSQTFIGKVVNHYSTGLEGKKVEIYFNNDGVNKRFLDWTDAEGNFSADSSGTLDVDDKNLLPDGYEVSLNYPQPFNPKTIFNITLPHSSQISVDVFTILGERILTLDKKEFSAGTNKIVIELDGFSNGVYIARINIDDKHFVSRKLLLLYGSQHAKETQISSNLDFLSKPTTITNIDSVVITGDAIKKTTFTGFQQYTGNNIELGTFTVDSNYVNLIFNVKKIMEWTQPNNQQTNALINLSGQEATTEANGQANFITPSGKNTLTITHPEIYTRETILRLEKDSTHTEYIIDTLNYSQILMNFTDDILGKIINGEPYKMRGRWTEPPIFYIVADTTQEPGRERALQQIAKIDTVLAPAYTSPEYPEGFLKNREIQIGTTNVPYGQEGYYVITWENISPNIGLTYVETDTATGKIKYAQTRYNELADANTMERITIHELSSGMSAAGRSNAISSVWNTSPTFDERNFVPTDLQMILYQYSRPPGNKIVDKDEGF
jgi:hypothetical protein